MIGRQKFFVDLILLDVVIYDIIFWMDWLSYHGVTLQCQGKKVILKRPNQAKLKFQPTRPISEVNIVYALKMAKYGK